MPHLQSIYKYTSLSCCVSIDAKIHYFDSKTIKSRKINLFDLRSEIEKTNVDGNFILMHLKTDPSYGFVYS